MAKRILTHDDVSGACELALLAKYPVLTSGAGMVVTPTTNATTGEVSYSVSGATASDTQAGVIEIATPAETLTGTDATRAVTPAGVKAAIDATTSCNAPVATAAELATITNANRITTCIGGVEKSIPMSSIIAGSAAAPIVTAPITGAGTAASPFSVQSSTDTLLGVVELATPAEVVAGTDTTRAVTSAGVKAAIDATTSCNAPVATAAELAAITNANRITTCIGGVEKSIPMSSIIAGSAAAPETTAPITGAGTAANPFSVQASTDALSGVVELATPAETVTGTDTTRAVTPAGVKAAIDATAASIPQSGVGVPTVAPTVGQSVLYVDTTNSAIGHPDELYWWTGSAWKILSRPEYSGFSAAGRSAESLLPHDVAVQLGNWVNIIDPQGSFNAASGVFTVPTSGLYSVSGSIYGDSTMTYIHTLAIFLNGVESIRIDQKQNSSATSDGEFFSLLTGSSIGYFTAGDQVTLRVLQGNTLGATRTTNFGGPTLVTRFTVISV